VLTSFADGSAVRALARGFEGLVRALARGFEGLAG
jgi:hypothetical protein